MDCGLWVHLQLCSEILRRLDSKEGENGAWN